MSVRKLPFIQFVKLAPIDGSEVIPTVLYYEGGRVLIGREAREKCPSPELLVEDFKIELGHVDPDNPVRRSGAAEKSSRRTALGLTKDYFDEVLKKLETWLALQGLARPSKILIAEPLSLADSDKVSESWLSNYRRSIRNKVLHGRFTEIDFLPEPFAVYQYYRYGAHHPIVAEKRKHIALVLDFGGGTFDVSVVESAKSGEISQSGVNARPLSARSIPIGGFYINRILATDLLQQALEKKIDRSEVKKALAFCDEHRNADEEFLSRLSDRQRTFFRNYKTLLQRIERAKISVCKALQTGA